MRIATLLLLLSLSLVAQTAPKEGRKPEQDQERRPKPETREENELDRRKKPETHEEEHRQPRRQAPVPQPGEPQMAEPAAAPAPAPAEAQPASPLPVTTPAQPETPKPPPQMTVINKAYPFDVAKIGQPGRPETKEKFAQIWACFLGNYALGKKGTFMKTAEAETPDNRVTEDEFLHFVAENSPTIVLKANEKCSRCSGRGTRPAIVNLNEQGTQTQVAEITCESCQGLRETTLIETIKLSYSGKLPERPSRKARKAVGKATPGTPEDKDAK